MKREISRLRGKLQATNSQGKRFKAMSVSLASAPVVRRSTVLSFLFNFVSDHPSPKPTFCPKWEIVLMLA